ncbi:MFS transporter [Zeaxanthinibacter enoshimensis]|uniref:MFS transporter n=1 Tax=Zeaxanthinibacter enoshimensis TaxID=392009 RepID=A0A4R6TIK7_9FLAO|nr:MFS transporter [Zeaxanthinibacter enoshimensis]TDQ29100.1 MFS transporter [Zeaxanthinibacter enoshimensis]
MSEQVKKYLIDPRQTPFFYGYLILLIGTIGIWASVPGQTIGVSVFTDPVKDALGLSRNQFSNAYMLGTILSSLVIGKAGVWFDRYGARIVAFGAALTLALALVLCSFAVHMSEFVKELLDVNSWMVPFVLMIGLFFMLRFAGQGVLTMASRNVIMIWFDKHRGKVNMFSSIALSFGFSASPLWLNALIETEGWAGAWRYLAAGLLVIALLILVFYKNSPEAYGLFPDGTRSEEEQQEKIARALAQKQFTLKEARRTRAFWMYALILAFNSFFITGFTFHVISIFADAGMPKEEAIAIFLPCSVVSVSVSTLFNFLSDYVRLKWYLYLMILGGFCAATGLLLLSAPIGVVLVIAGIGILGGFFAVLNAIAWPRFFGRSNLGAITGKVMSLLILGSALAPPVFSWYFSTLGSYKLLAYPAMGFLLFLAVGALKADNPQEKIKA